MGRFPALKRRAEPFGPCGHKTIANSWMTCPQFLPPAAAANSSPAPTPTRSSVRREQIIALQALIDLLHVDRERVVYEDFRIDTQIVRDDFPNP
jgi:hypothetical protein